MAGAGPIVMLYENQRAGERRREIENPKADREQTKKKDTFVRKFSPLFIKISEHLFEGVRKYNPKAKFGVQWPYDSESNSANICIQLYVSEYQNVEIKINLQPLEATQESSNSLKVTVDPLFANYYYWFKNPVFYDMIKNIWGQLSFTGEEPPAPIENIVLKSSNGIDFYDYMAMAEKRMVLIASLISTGFKTVNITRATTTHTYEQLEMTVVFSGMVSDDYVNVLVNISAEDTANICSMCFVGSGLNIWRSTKPQPETNQEELRIKTAQQFTAQIQANRYSLLLQHHHPAPPVTAALLAISRRLDVILARE